MDTFSMSNVTAPISANAPEVQNVSAAEASNGNEIKREPVQILSFSDISEDHCYIVVKPENSTPSKTVANCVPTATAFKGKKFYPNPFLNGTFWQKKRKSVAPPPTLPLQPIVPSSNITKAKSKNVKVTKVSENTSKPVFIISTGNNQCCITSNQNIVQACKKADSIKLPLTAKTEYSANTPISTVESRPIANRSEKEISLRAKLNTKRVQYCRLSKKHQALIQKYNQVVSEISEIKAANKRNLESTFVGRQQRLKSKKMQGRRFAKHDIDFAISLYACSPDAYHLCEKVFVLPAVKSLTRLIKKRTLLSSTKTILSDSDFAIEDNGFYTVERDFNRASNATNADNGVVVNSTASNAEDVTRFDMAASNVVFNYGVVKFDINNVADTSVVVSNMNNALYSDVR